MIPLGGPVAAQGPVIPDFGEGSDCVVENRLFCPDWVRDNWSGTLQPALLEHVKLTIIAVVIGFVISFGAALLTHRLRLFEKPLVVFAAVGAMAAACGAALLPAWRASRLDPSTALRRFG